MPADDLKDLPIIRVVATRDVDYAELDLEMEDDTFEMLVKWGQEDATDQDFVNIAIREGLKNYIKNEDNN